MSVGGALSLRAVTKALGGTPVLREVSFDVPAGHVTALLGPNGAGKTTAVTLAAGQRHPDSGQVLVCGHDVASGDSREHLSLVPQEIGFPDAVTVGALLAFVEQQRPASPLAPPRDELLDRLGTGPLLHRRVGGLSGGQRRRVALTLGLLAVPEALVLDEATTNLDEQARATTWELVTEYVARGGAALVTSHILGDIDAHASRIVALTAGSVVAECALADIRSRLGGSVVSVRIGGASAALLQAAARGCGYGSGSVEREGWLRWRARRPARLAAAIYDLAPEAELTVSPMSLAEILDSLADSPEVTIDAPSPHQHPDPAR